MFKKVGMKAPASVTPWGTHPITTGGTPASSSAGSFDGLLATGLSKPQVFSFGFEVWCFLRFFGFYGFMEGLKIVCGVF